MNSFRFWMMFLTLLGLACPSKNFADDELDLPAIAELHSKEASAYTMTLNGDEQPLEMQKTPIFKWQNITAESGQVGAIYVWTKEGRPEVIGTVFSQPQQNQRNVIHEFHTLAQKELIVDCPKDVRRMWVPKGTLPMKPIVDAPSAAQTPAKRLIQMRQLANEFSAFTHDGQNRVELRLATQPLIRYQPTRPDVLDGALFAFLNSSAGTDPEVMLMIEARHTDAQPADWTWHRGIARFTDRNLVVTRKDVQIFSSIADPNLRASIEDNYRWIHNADDTYVVFQAKFVPELLLPPKP